MPLATATGHPDPAEEPDPYATYRTTYARLMGAAAAAMRRSVRLGSRTN
jgi:hypothetical protein